jgi:hypothetical protein
VKRIRVGGNRRNSPIRGWALVDDEDFERFSAHSWHMHEGYAARNERQPDGRKRIVLMHREILGLERGDGWEADHINRDRLDNQRENLRVLTKGQQRQNMTTYSSSGYRGVSFHEGRWRARAFHVNLGGFDTPEQAAAAAAAYRAQHMPYSEEAQAA